MNYLVGDIGNTLIKLSILNSSYKIKKVYNFKTNQIFKNNFKTKYLNNVIKKKIFKKVLFSSVVPKAYKIIKNHMKN